MKLHYVIRLGAVFSSNPLYKYYSRDSNYMYIGLANRHL